MSTASFRSMQPAPPHLQPAPFTTCKPQRHAVALAVVGLACFAAGSLLTALLLRPASQAAAPQPAVDAVAVRREAPVETRSDPSQPLPAESDLPVDLVEGPFASGLQLGARLSRVNRYSEE